MTRDLRRYASQTNVRLFLGGVILLFIVGDGLIYAFFGPGAAVTGLLCLAAGLLPLGVVWGALWLMDWVVKRAGRD